MPSDPTPQPSQPSDAPPDQAPTPNSGSGYPPAYPSYPPYPPYPDAGYPQYPYPAPYPAPYAAPGYPVYPGYFPWMYAPAPRLSTWALVSMICGAVAIVSFQSVLAILAVVFGFIGLNEVKKSVGQVEGRGLAIAGVVLGFVSLGIGLLILLLYILYFVVLFSAFSAFPG